MSVHVSLLVYRLKLLKLPPTFVSSILLLFHIFTVPHLPSLRPIARFWSLQVSRKFRGFCFEFLNVRQPLLKDPRLLLPLLDLAVDDQAAATERSWVKRICLLTSE